MEPETMPWYKSRVFIGLTVSFLTHLGALFGKNFDPTILTLVVDDGLEILSFLALAYAGWHRARSVLQPLTLSKKEEKIDGPTTNQ